MASSLYNRNKPQKSTPTDFSTTPVHLGFDAANLSVGVDIESRSNGLGADTLFGDQFGKALPMQKIDLTGGINVQSLLNRRVTDQQAKYGKMIGWFRLILGSLYGIAALALLFVVIFKAHDEFPLYWDPMRWDGLSNQWVVALENAGMIHVAWAILALGFVFCPYQFAHFLSFVRDIYLRLVFYYEMNPIRWIFHGVVGGMLVSFFSIILGVSNVIVFVFLVFTFLAAAASILFSEMINRPNLYNVDKEKDTSVELVNTYGLTEAEANEAVKEGYFIQSSVSTPWPILAGVIMLTLAIAIMTTYFGAAVLKHSGRVPWYAYTTYLITVGVLAVLGIVNSLRLLISWRFLQNYLYIDLLHNVVEAVFLINVLLIIIGLSV